MQCRSSTAVSNLMCDSLFRDELHSYRMGMRSMPLVFRRLAVRKLGPLEMILNFKKDLQKKKKQCGDCGSLVLR